MLLSQPLGPGRKQFQGILLVFSYHGGSCSTAKWINVRIMPLLSISILSIKSETVQVCEPTGLTKKQTYVGISFTIRSPYASTLTGRHNGVLHPKVSMSVQTLSYRAKKVWVFPQCAVTLTQRIKFFFKNIGEYLPYILVVVLARFFLKEIGSLQSRDSVYKPT